jgi:hypothetical protein
VWPLAVGWLLRGRFGEVRLPMHCTRCGCSCFGFGFGFGALLPGEERMGTCYLCEDKEEEEGAIR